MSLIQSRLVEADLSEVELRILGHLRAAYERDHERERSQRELNGAIMAIVLVVVIAIWSVI